MEGIVHIRGSSRGRPVRGGHRGPGRPGPGAHDGRGPRRPPAALQGLRRIAVHRELRACVSALPRLRRGMCRKRIVGLGAIGAREPTIHHPPAATQATMGEVPAAQAPPRDRQAHAAAQLTARPGPRRPTAYPRPLADPGEVITSREPERRKHLPVVCHVPGSDLGDSGALPSHDPVIVDAAPGSRILPRPWPAASSPHVGTLAIARATVVMRQDASTIATSMLTAERYTS